MADALAVDTDRLDGWIADRLEGFGLPLTADRLGLGAGIANALYLVRRGDHAWVLRMPPKVKNDPSASDTLREWRILTALEGTAVPHPAPRLLCEDVGVLGAPFLVMDVVDGFTPGVELPEPFAGDGSLRADLAMAYVDGCAALSAVDWRARGLEGLGKPEGFLERQVTRWLAQLARYETRELPELGFVTDWLEANRPEMSAPGLIHGDYSPFNVMVARAAPARLAAIVDWDTGTIGDPLLDIGHLLARWTEPGEDAVISELPGGVWGYPSRAEMAARYGAATGRDLAALPYYEALALFKLAVILEGTFARERAAGVPDSANSMGEIVPRLLRGAAAFASGERR
ncbi:MAG TPA: phosphotransferase family protein [Acidimicrobiales bacterium]|nr:phosphotransferase family protein [Acidimicrobiales bacterium]